ncbi:MAG: mepM 1 [Gammaproteobacteria bacterium]|jgi:murein DD-endopeptidase MepM/ murein hydrolase activator NlpD|nr:mepM 1 [Gammaproteobacteria bacterium]
MRKIFRADVCSFSHEIRDRQILRGLGLTALVTLAIAAHLEQIGKLTPLSLQFSRAPTTEQIAAPIATVPAVTQAATPAAARKTSAPRLPANWSIENGNVKGSFVQSAKHAGLTLVEIHSLNQIFSNKIDFKHLPAGTQFKVITERVPAKTSHGVTIDNVVAAEFITRAQKTLAIRYSYNNAPASYYQADGTSLAPGFLRYPTHFTRIGSGFMLHRLDPVTGQYHSHPAIDFDAPMGSPITATSDGKINTMTFEQGYGNVVKISHPGNVMTLYAHMRNFAKGLHTGSLVKKGQVIGYVGMTGYATGPHVHYELHFGSKPVNPLTTKLPAAASIPSAQRAGFNQEVKQVLGLIG